MPVPWFLKGGRVKRTPVIAAGCILWPRGPGDTGLLGEAIAAAGMADKNGINERPDEAMAP